MNNSNASSQLSQVVEHLRDACPFFLADAATCWALRAAGKIDEKQRRRCGCDDHDACPRFLSRLSRSGRPWSTGPVLDMRHK